MLRRLQNPNARRRAAYALLASAGVTSGVAEAVRTLANDGASWTYLLDTMALFLAAGGAAMEAWAATVFGAVDPGGTRRRGIVFLAGGSFVALLSCVLVSIAVDG